MSKTEVSGKQLKDGSVELVDLAPEVSGVLNTLQSDVATLQTDVAAKADAGNLAAVATSGSYNDLSNKPTIPSLTAVERDVTALQSDVATLQTDVAAKADASSLAAVATSGSYADLNNKPTIPSLTQVESDISSLDTRVTAVEGDVAALEASAFSGSYTDLTDKPTIPSVVGLASETYVDTAVAGVVNSAPAVLDTLNELAAALGNDENFATTVAGQIGDVAADVSALDTRVTAVEGDVATLQTDVASKANTSSLATVATSGSYIDLTNKPSLFSGAYADLTGKPTLFSGAYADLTGAPSLATVATSGSYAHLTNKPTIPAALSDLTTLTSPSSGQVLTYNGSAWINQSLTAANGSTPGIVSAGDQVFSGRKSLWGGLTAKAPWVNQTAITISPYSASQSAALVTLDDGTNQTFSITKDGTTTVTLASASAKAMVLKGAASQTANLLEVQNSSASSLVSVDSTGKLTLAGGGWNSFPLHVTGAMDNNPSSAVSSIMMGQTGGYGKIMLVGSNTGIIDFVTPNNNANWNGRILGGAGLITIGTSNSAGTSRGYPAWFGGWDATYPSLSLVALNAAAKGLVIKGAASQSANLLEVQNSSGTALTYVDANGYLNTYLGYVNSVYVGIRNTSRSVYVGDRAGESNAATYQDNTAIGFEAARYNTTGYENVAVGKSAMGAANSTAYRNTAVGFYAGAYMTSAFANTMVGHLAGNAVTTATWNTLIGKDAGTALTTSGGNTFVGGQAGLAANNTTNAVFIGASCGAVGTDMSYSVGIGVSAHKNGYNNVAIGFECGKNMTNQENQNVYIGNSAAQQGFHQSKNVIIGYNAQQANTTYGSSQIAIGWGAACTGSSALAIGASASAADSCMDIRFGGASRMTGDSSGNIAIANTLHAKRYTETVANAFNSSLAPSTGTLTVDTSLGNAVLGALNAAVTTWAFTNVPTDNSKVTTVTAVIAGNASYTYGDACSVNGSAVTGGVMWSGGSAPTATAGTDIITFIIVKDSAGTIKVFGSATTNFS